MISRLTLVFLFIAAILSQFTPPATQPQLPITTLPYFPPPPPPTPPTVNPFLPTQPPFIAIPPTSPGGSSSGDSNSVDIDESRATGLINTLFGNNPTAIRAIQSTSTPAPSNAPAGAQISSFAPSAAMTSSASLIGGPSGRIIRWGRWVRILRCNWQWNGGFCCNWVWVWRWW